MQSAQGQRVDAGFILITGLDGTRYAVWQQAIAVIHDADECHDETIVQLHGGMCSRCRYRSMSAGLGLLGEDVVKAFHAARLEDLGPGDVVTTECACRHAEFLTAAMLGTAGVKLLSS